MLFCCVLLLIEREYFPDLDRVRRLPLCGLLVEGGVLLLEVPSETSGSQLAAEYDGSVCCASEEMLASTVAA